MSLLDRILYGPGISAWDLSQTSLRIKPEVKAAYDLVPTGVLGRPQYPDTDISSLLSMYERNAVVYAAINRKASAAIGPRLLVEKRNRGNTWTEVEAHPFRMLLSEPNDMMDESSLLGAYIVSMDTTGIFYAEITRTNGLPTGLHPLDPSKVAPIPGEKGAVKEYLFKQGNQKVRIPAEDMLMDMLPNIRSQYKPLSPLVAAMGDIDADNAQTDFIRAFFNNGGRPSGIMKILGRTITQDQANEIRAKWRMLFNRTLGYQHDIAVLDENAEYQKVGSSLNEIQSRDLRMFYESRIFSVLRVPPLIVYSYAGLEKATYSNLKEAWRGFWDADLMPLLSHYSSWLSRRLLTQFIDKALVLGGVYRLHYDMSDVPWMQEDMDSVHKRALDDFKAGALTLNEYRAKKGEIADPAGDYYLRSSGGAGLVPYPFGVIEQAEDADAAPKSMIIQAPYTNGHSHNLLAPVGGVKE